MPPKVVKETSPVNMKLKLKVRTEYSTNTNEGRISKAGLFESPKNLKGSYA